MDTKGGLITQIWGPSFWHVLHCITFNYPKNPSESDKHNYKHFFKKTSGIYNCNQIRFEFIYF